jgi:hypothetical protein
LFLIISLLLISRFATSCSNKNNKLSIGDNIHEIYKYYEKNQVILLKHCAIISDKQNIFVDLADTNIISNIKYINYAEFDYNLFIANYAKSSLDSLISLIGGPSFIGLQGNESIDFLDNTENIYRLYLNYNNGKYSGYQVETLDRDNSESWLDSSKASLPSKDDVKKIKIDMTLDEVVKYIGKPQRDIGSGGWIFEFDIADGSIFKGIFNYNFEKDASINNTELNRYNLYLYEYEIIIN